MNRKAQQKNRVHFNFFVGLLDSQSGALKEMRSKSFVQWAFRSSKQSFEESATNPSSLKSPL
jgi:hypothetical protein